MTNNDDATSKSNQQISLIESIHQTNEKLEEEKIPNDRSEDLY